ncbi:lysine-specific demethylase ELF6 [Amaranthus tricolor]|uniref:lysine-specific demethylase ELF6 n=1 Tax=Amaranthus tricolor TaxID=29722 RepID=UPI0025836078|nr:lysine-specific demethylase ELF6 [Amaranthus tricolor]
MGDFEIPQWLKDLPLAPEFRPTDTEFADPIAYISKIEKEASVFGICKVIPPLPKPSKRFVFNNLNKSLLRTRELGLDLNLTEPTDSSKRGSINRAVFTTRQQELGQDSKRIRVSVDSSQPGSQKQVWQSGEFYTLEQFESKSKAFSRRVLGSIKDVSPLVIETLFWKAVLEKPIYVEYANDVPGSGFGEPEGMLGYSCTHKKRRKLCSKTQGGKSYSYWGQSSVNDARNLPVEVEIEPLISDLRPFSESGKESIDQSNSSFDDSSHSKKRGLCADAELEGTAGWKLSNCPWNLQVIARSAGSLTRFMLDDIPGVTSPMVYIGMLFSWFAWHVEDHELHSLNFLHTGSPKTWYAVPGEYAFAFEDVIRKQAYGGDLDHLAALKLLGEKTTLLSPELVVASGIPCCRLVQNPGEYVVTFPRAYHIGFSHGFNCGEAANFGTPQWLTIAKEAAVRRAVMDQLPMLSHQQLLYLLTMSFIYCVPRTLLPGARSSRLKNRLKEEREQLVKKAFIEDILEENYLLNTLIENNSAIRAVLWHPDSLPSFTELSSVGTVLDTELSVPSLKPVTQDIHPLITDRRTSNDLYLDSNDLSCDFQIDSGTLVCVACGILGYPIMSVVQPSKQILMEKCSSEEVLHIPLLPDSCIKNVFPETYNEERWDNSGFLRPRIFCLEHAVQVEKLLQSKGGSKMLVICHSDYQKIKANARAIAEELKTSYNYKEVQLDTASQEDLKIIDIAIHSEQLTDFQEDWTSKLGINLRLSVKTRKSCLPTKIEHALNIDYLLSIMSPVTRFSKIKWCSRKSRTKRESNHKRLDGNLCKKDTIEVSDSMEIRGKILLQYYRKKYRVKMQLVARESLAPMCSSACSRGETDTNCRKINEIDEQGSSKTPCYKKAEADSEKCSVVSQEAEEPYANIYPTSNETSEMLVTTCTESTATVEVDMPVLPVDSLNDTSQMGLRASSLSNEREEKGKRKGKRIIEVQNDAEDNFIRSPCEGLRPRKNKGGAVHTEQEKSRTKKKKKSSDKRITYPCDYEGCRMCFTTKGDLLLHNQNRCHHKECGKAFRSHKYVVLHQRVHDDERPLKCTWGGCAMTFKWAWARTEHMRLHTGERLYQCKIKGCGLTFRFVSDFSRHRQKTGHLMTPPPK